MILQSCKHVTAAEPETKQLHHGVPFFLAKVTGSPPSTRDKSGGREGLRAWDENGTDIFRPYSKPNLFSGVEICPYPNTQIAYL